MARNKGAAAAPKTEAKPKAEKKPAAKAKAAKAAPAGKAAPPQRSTASILAAARGTDSKPGPMSKAEAAAKAPAAKGKPTKKAKAPLVAPPMPEKPAYAKAKPAPVAEGETRRSFIGILFGTALAGGMTMLAIIFGLWSLALARFMFPNVLTEPPSQFKVGFPDAFAFGMVETKFKAQFGIWVVNYEYQGQRQLYALSTVCTHLGCTPNWLEGEQKFKCPCHGSGFYKDGVNFEGPAPRPLERYAIRIADDGQVEIDKSKKFQEEMGDWEDSSSYVPV